MFQIFAEHQQTGLCVCICVCFYITSHKHNHLLPCEGGKYSMWSSFSHFWLEGSKLYILGPIHAGANIVSFDYEGRDADPDGSYMLICMLSEWFMQIMHIIPKGIPPQTARINCRKLAIKSVVLGAKGEGHWESKDIQFLESSRLWWWLLFALEGREIGVSSESCKSISPLKCFQQMLTHTVFTDSIKEIKC